MGPDDPERADLCGSVADERNESRIRVYRRRDLFHRLPPGNSCARADLLRGVFPSFSLNRIVLGTVDTVEPVRENFSNHRADGRSSELVFSCEIADCGDHVGIVRVGMVSVNRRCTVLAGDRRCDGASELDSFCRRPRLASRPLPESDGNEHRVFTLVSRLDMGIGGAYGGVCVDPILGRLDFDPLDSEYVVESECGHGHGGGLVGRLDGGYRRHDLGDPARGLCKNPVDRNSPAAAAHVGGNPLICRGTGLVRT